MDNYFQSCPPRGTDSRHFTDYKTATRRNEHIKYLNGNLTRDDEYRIFLQKNGVEIMKRDFEQHQMQNLCQASQCVHTYPTRVPPQSFAEELARYNAKAAGQQHPQNVCPKFDDYKATSY